MIRLSIPLRQALARLSLPLMIAAAFGIMLLGKAASLLAEQKYKVNEICYMVGFNTPSYFAKCFFRQFGVLPKDFVG